MLTYSFTDIGSDHLYEYLYKCIKNDIAAGILAPGTRLPSKRSFAANLGVSTITVEAAYGQLLAEGYLYSLPRKGYYVEEIHKEGTAAAVSASPPAAKPAAPPILPISSATRRSRKIFLSPSGPKILREVMLDHSAELMTNPPAGGVLVLREAIASYLRAFRGMRVLPEQIVVGAGTEYLYGLLIQLLGYGRRYAVEDPGYRKITRIYMRHGVKCVHLPLDAQGISMRALAESGADIVHVSPSHHYPSGIVTPVSRRYELLGWASGAAGRYILEDDFDSEFRMAGNPLPTLQGIDATERVIYLNTFTKSLASTIRISYMVLPAHLAARFYKELGFYSCTVSTFEQYTLARFLSGGYFEKHINRMRNLYRRKRDILIRTIRAALPPGAAEISEEEAGLHFLLRVAGPRTDAELVRCAERSGLRVACLSAYYAKSPGDTRTLVLNYSNIPQDRLALAADKLAGILK